MKKRKRASKHLHCRFCTFEISTDSSFEVGDSEALRVNSRTSKVACAECWQKVQDLLAPPPLSDSEEEEDNDNRASPIVSFFSHIYFLFFSYTFYFCNK